MAKLSDDKTYVIVEWGDTLSQIALTYLGSASKYKELAAINNIENPDKIYLNQKIMLKASDSPDSTNSKAPDPNKAVVSNFGLQSDAQDQKTLFATWTWSKKNTDSYKVAWDYATGDGVWFVGSHTSITVDSDNTSASRQSTYSIPSNATKVRFKVKPISKKYKKNNKETSYWTAAWSDVKTYNVSDNPPKKPPVPTVELEKYTLTATLDNLDVDGDTIQFQIVKDNSAKAYKSSNVSIVSAHAAYSCKVAAGGKYKVRCRAVKDKQYSDWSEYSTEYGTAPSAPKSITKVEAKTKTSVLLTWEAANGATSYDIEYATERDDFDITDTTTTKNVVGKTTFEITGLESGKEYFFRIRAVNDELSVSNEEDKKSGWTKIVSVVIGKKPAPPTTWSSTTTATVGDILLLYWVHNTQDGSSQVKAQLELTVNGKKLPLIEVVNSTDEDEKDKTSVHSLSTSSYKEGTTITWKVRTNGITGEYSDWSIERTIDVYAPPSLSMNITDKSGDKLFTVESFPFYISMVASPQTQTAIGYHIAITANESYITLDPSGNEKIVAQDETVYSKYFDTLLNGNKNERTVEFSANNIDLENNISYTVVCTVTMDSGLTATDTDEFDVEWVDVDYQPNAEISLDEEALTAEIRPYVETTMIKRYEAIKTGTRLYAETTKDVGRVYGELIKNAKTTSGYSVYSGTTVDGEEITYYEVEERTVRKNVMLSVYRREFDGSYVEIASELDGSKNITVTDPHPALDFARYRIVATDKATGSISYYDPPGYPVGGAAVVIQWDEEWTEFDTTEASALEQPAWAGSMLRLPYNVDVSDNHKSDVALVEYIGRSHPVSYYGTQLGHSASWNVSVPKEDKDTLYALRRLARWMGDVYVREPSGSGYWANITVAFSQKHCEVTIPVTLDITRVEGGM